MTPWRAILFDLDGTLVDTAADLLGTLDDVRAELGLAPCAAGLPAAVAARGGRGILNLGFPDDASAADRLLPRYLQLYAARLARSSRPYPGVIALLDRLHANGIAAGIVTNKPQRLARQLLDELGWSARIAVLVGGDTLSVRKPAPEPVLEPATVPAPARTARLRQRHGPNATGWSGKIRPIHAPAGRGCGLPSVAAL